MDKNNNNILFIFIIWFFLFCLGVIYLIKYKLWKTDNYWIIITILFSFIIIFFQIRVLYLCFSKNNIYEGNRTFTLVDRNIGVPWQAPNDGDAPQQFNWDSPLNYGAFRHANEYNGNRNNLCNKHTIIQLTELQAISAQQLQDATRSYNALKEIYDILNQDNLI
jgi:hypothetical protein